MLFGCCYDCIYANHLTDGCKIFAKNEPFAVCDMKISYESIDNLGQNFCDNSQNKNVTL